MLTEAFYRSKKIAKREFNSQRLQWDAAFAAGASAANLTAALLLFYSSSSDYARLQQLCQLLGSKLDGGVEWVEADVTRWRHLLDRLVCTIAGELGRPIAGTAHLRTLMYKLADGRLSHFISFAGMVEKTLIFCRISSMLASAANVQAPDDLRLEIEAWVINLVSAVFRAGMEGSQRLSVLRSIVTELLSTVYLEDTFSKQFLRKFISALPLAELLQLLTDTTLVQTLDTNALFCNITALFMMEPENKNGPVMQLFLQTLLTHLPEAQQQDDIDEMDIDESPVNSSGSNSHAFENQKQYIKRLVAPGFLHSLVTQLYEPSITSACCSFLATYISRFRIYKDKVLSFLALNRPSNILSAIWRAASQSKLLDQLHRQPFFVPAIYSTEYGMAEAWSCLILFSELYSKILLTVGDDEFFGTNPPFPIEDLLVYISNMKVCTLTQIATFQLLWNWHLIQPNLPRNYPGLAEGKELFAKVLRQFCPDDFWLVAEHGELEDTLQTLPFQADELFETKLHRCAEVLRLIPFVIPFKRRVKLFRAFISNDRGNNCTNDFRNRVSASIRRGHVFEDGYAQLNAAKASLKGGISIRFLDEFGIPEAGIDGGGLFKEFLTSCVKEAFAPDFGLFETTKDNLLYPGSTEYASQAEQLDHLMFMGRIIGKALFDGVLIDSSFAGFFLQKWLGASSYLDDLPSLDNELYQGLLFVKNYNGDVERDLSLTFTVSEQLFGVSKDVDLIPNGSMIPVTNQNRIRYIYLVANYKLNVKIAKQCAAFFTGLIELIDPSWIKMFDQKELQILLGGNAVPINIDDLKENCLYDGIEYNPESETIKMFWEVVAGFSEDEKRKLVKFVTSCSRPPLLGFKELNPKFSIRPSGADQDRLRIVCNPASSSTCVNLLKLPMYTSKEIMRM